MRMNYIIDWNGAIKLEWTVNGTIRFVLKDKIKMNIRIGFINNLKPWNSIPKLKTFQLCFENSGRVNDSHLNS